MGDQVNFVVTFAPPPPEAMRLVAKNSLKCYCSRVVGSGEGQDFFSCCVIRWLNFFAMMRSLNTVTDEGNLGSIIFNFTEISRNHPARTILLSTRRNASRFTKAFQLFEDQARRIENAEIFSRPAICC